jgi:hypothetical protein
MFWGSVKGTGYPLNSSVSPSLILQCFTFCFHTSAGLHCLHICQGLGYFSRYSDSLRTGRSRDRIPVGARFSAPVQNGPGAHPAFYTMGTGYIPWIKRPGRGVNHPPTCSAEVKERVGLYLYSLSGTSLSVLGWTWTYPCICLEGQEIHERAKSW